MDVRVPGVPVAPQGPTDLRRTQRLVQRPLEVGPVLGL
ncbi:hypothetical protein SMALA_3697 [Streptomyces malaysiensis subsp. malaysiensis]|nr:hypothetical protein SMALA_3697 [Streptomyces malaysiensis]